MPIIKRDFSAGDYHVANDAPFLDENLSWQAKGVLGYLFSKPPDWTPRMYDIVASGPCKKHKIKSVFSELEEHGYLHRRKVRCDDGTFDWEVKIFDHPQSDPGWTESTPDAVHPGRDRGASNTDNKSLLNTNNTERESAPAREDDHPAIAAFTEEVGRRPYPNEKMEIPSVVGEHPQHLKTFRAECKKAVRNAGSPEAVKWGYLAEDFKRAREDVDDRAGLLDMPNDFSRAVGDTDA